jgi:hypothetical protein
MSTADAKLQTLPEAKAKNPAGWHLTAGIGLLWNKIFPFDS